MNFVRGEEKKREVKGNLSKNVNDTQTKEAGKLERDVDPYGFVESCFLRLSMGQSWVEVIAEVMTAG